MEDTPITDLKLKHKEITQMALDKDHIFATTTQVIWPTNAILNQKISKIHISILETGI